MGVLGLTPFIQRTCPEVIRTIPNRLRGLAGKTVAIDGTLITHRLHFAPLPVQNKHILGWYRLITDLREADVQVICVFDGRTRSAAKKAEVERRREAMRLTVARSSVENARLTRFGKLSQLLTQVENLPLQEKQLATELLGQLAKRRQSKPAAVVKEKDESSKDQDTPSPKKSVAAKPASTTAKPIKGTSKVPIATSEASTERPGEDISGIITEKEDRKKPSGERSASKADRRGSQLAPSQLDLSGLTSPGVSTSEVDRLMKALGLLYAEFWASTDQQSPPDQDPTAKSDSVSVSKFQQRLSLDEAQLWDNIISQTPIPPDFALSASLPASAEDIEFLDMEHDLDSLSSAQPESLQYLQSLTHRSNAIATSYIKRTNLPTSQTYEETQKLLRAMGVPCVVASAPFEAEGVASALVHAGRAECVASEDTDVLIYEAPLLKNITSRLNPITQVSGAEVRQALGLDRAAFVDFALLLETDFSQRLPNIGPTRALKLILKHGCIENLLSNEAGSSTTLPKGLTAQQYLDQVRLGREVFETLPPAPAEADIDQGVHDEAKVNEILRTAGLWDILLRGENNGETGLGTGWESEDGLHLLGANYFDDRPSVNEGI